MQRWLHFWKALTILPDINKLKEKNMSFIYIKIIYIFLVLSGMQLFVHLIYTL